MKTLFAVIALAIAASAHAGKPTEVCEEATLGKNGWEYKPVPCAVDPEESARERQCGKDYRALRVGMSLKRFEQCWESLSYVTETVRGGGTVETWRSTFYIIHASNGRIIAYSRR